MIAFENPLLAWRKARLGKTRNSDVLHFHLGLERELLALQRELDKARISPTREGLTVLGYRVWPTRRRLRNDNGLRFRRRLWGMGRGYQQQRLTKASIDPQVRAWIGHAIHGDTEGLRQKLFGDFRLVRGSAG